MWRLGFFLGFWKKFLGTVNAVPLSQFLDFLQCVTQDHIVALKFKVPEKLLLLQQQREPQDVIWPHLAEGNLVRIEPLRPHFWRREKEKCKPSADKKQKLCEATLGAPVCEVALPGSDILLNDLSTPGCWLVSCRLTPLLVSDFCLSCALLCLLASFYWPRLHDASSLA